VPAAAVIRGEQALSKKIWRKEFVDGFFKLKVKYLSIPKLDLLIY